MLTGGSFYTFLAHGQAKRSNFDKNFCSQGIVPPQLGLTGVDVLGDSRDAGQRRGRIVEISTLAYQVALARYFFCHGAHLKRKSEEKKKKKEICRMMLTSARLSSILRPPPTRRLLKIAGWSSQVARQAHNLKAAGSNPAPAIRKIAHHPMGDLFCMVEESLG